MSIMVYRIGASEWKKVDELVAEIKESENELKMAETDENKEEIRGKKIMLICELRGILKNWSFVPRPIANIIR